MASARETVSWPRYCKNDQDRCTSTPLRKRFRAGSCRKRRDTSVACHPGADIRSIRHLAGAGSHSAPRL